jgi:hypothetical protein
MRLAKKAMSSGRCSRRSRKIALRKSSARSASSSRSAKAIVGVVVEVGEGDLRLDHPELGEVTRRVGVLGPEGRPEGVDLRERLAVGLDLELSRDREEGGSSKEVLAVVDLAGVVTRQVHEVERRDAEQGAGALAVAAGDDRRVDPGEAVLVEVAVDRPGQGVPHAGDRPEGVGPRPQVGDLAQVLEAVTLGRDGIGVGIVDPADDLDGLGGQLDGLALALALHEIAAADDRAAGGELEDLGLVVRQLLGADDLEGVEAGAVADGQEGEPRLGVAACPDPAPHGHRRAHPHRAPEDVGDRRDRGRGHRAGW